MLGNDIKSKDDASKNAKKKGQRLKIVEVESTEDSVGDAVRPSGEGTGDDSKVGLDDQNRVVKNGLEARKSKDAGDATAKDPEISVKNIALVDENSQTSSSTNEVKDINSKITATTLQELHAKPAEVTATEKAKVSLELPVKVKSLMEEGNKLYKTGHYAEALQKYSKCVKHLWKGKKNSYSDLGYERHKQAV